MTTNYILIALILLASTYGVLLVWFDAMDFKELSDRMF